MPNTHTILLADDDPAVRVLWTRFLAFQNYAILAAANGEEALELFRANQVDLVLSDVDMPRLNGIALLRQLRQLSPNLPVILITGKPEVAAAVECMRVGALDYLAKPCDLKDLAGKIERVLRPQGGTSEQTVALPAPPERFVGPYKLRRLLGEGGNGMVFLAERDGQEYALKVLREELLLRSTQSGRWVARFQREAAVATTLRHERLVPVVDYGTATDSSVPYLVMPYIQGCGLDALERSYPRADLLAKARLLMEVAEGLAVVHAAGICHRDIKPQNVLVRASDFHALLTDFGIARVPDSELSLAGELLGTPYYMAPEAFDTTAVDARADLFSLGALSYSVLVGRKAFQGNSVAAMAHQIASGRPTAPSRLVPGFPAPLEQILALLLQKDPDQRYPTAGTLVADLQAFLAGQPLSPLVAQRRGQAQSTVWC